MRRLLLIALMLVAAPLIALLGAWLASVALSGVPREEPQRPSMLSASPLPAASPTTFAAATPGHIVEVAPATAVQAPTQAAPSAPTATPQAGQDAQTTPAFPSPTSPSEEPAPTPFPPPAPPVAAEERLGGPVAAPNAHPGPRWVTLQVGHLHNEELPSEQLHLSGHTGAFAAGVNEVDINLDVSRRAAALLVERGFNVDVIGAVVPVSYTTDLFLAIHADGNARSSWRGFKAVSPWVSVPASEEFVGFFYEEFGKATGLPADPFTSPSMADYYAFNRHTYSHAIDPRVPAALIELGFVSNPVDRRVMTEEADRLAWGIANAVDRWFRSGAAGPTPSPYPSFTPTRTATSTPTLTPSPTQTPTMTATPLPPELAPTMTELALSATPTESVPVATPSATAPSATPTPVTGYVGPGGRWLAPLAANGRSLPLPGTEAQPVLLSEAADEVYMAADGREYRQVWRQFYVSQIGRSVWRQGPLLLVRP